MQLFQLISKILKYINEVTGYKTGDKILKNFAANLMNMQGLHTRVTDHF